MQNLQYSIEAIATPTIAVSAHESIDKSILTTYYSNENIVATLKQTLAHLLDQAANTTLSPQPLVLPYYEHLSITELISKPIELDIYITDATEGRAINLQARQKNYATNILSYPSQLPEGMWAVLPMLPLGELIICHEVVVKQAQEQGKRLEDHITHLLVHGILHLLGFDHELGASEQQQMEAFEVAILAHRDVADPYP